MNVKKSIKRVAHIHFILVYEVSGRNWIARNPLILFCYVDRIPWVWLKKPNLVIWELDGEAICRLPWGEIWLPDKMHRRKYVAKNGFRHIIIGSERFNLNTPPLISAKNVILGKVTLNTPPLKKLKNSIFFLSLPWNGGNKKIFRKIFLPSMLKIRFRAKYPPPDKSRKLPPGGGVFRLKRSVGIYLVSIHTKYEEN